MKYFKYLTALSLMLLAQQAMALDLFAPPGGDKVVSLIGAIFESSAFGKIVNPIVVACMTAGAAVALYAIIAMTAQTAHEGEVMGRRFSTLWYPIRLVLAMALLAPVSGGYATVQYGVIWLGKQGVGLADQVYNAYVDVAVSGNLIAPKAGDPTPLAIAVLKDLTCMEASNYDNSQGGNNFAVGKGQIKQWSAPNANGDTVIGFGESDGDGTCGTITFKKSDDAMVSAVQAAHLAATKAMISALTPVAQAIGQGKIPYPTGVILPAIQAYQSSVNSALASINGSSTSNQTQAANLKAQGFAYAGSYYLDMAKRSSDFASAAGNLPAHTDADDGRASYNNMATDAIVPIGDLNLSTAMQAVDKYVDSELMTQSGTGGGKSASNSGDSHFTKIISSVADKVKDFRQDFETTITSNGNPILSLIHIGQACLALYAAIVSIVLTVSMVLGGIPTLTESSALLGSINHTLSLIYTILTYAGNFLAVYLPLIPMLVIFFFVVRFLILLAEAILGSILWMVAHLMPEGEGIAGQATQGYMLILNVLFTPALGIAAFAFAVISLNPIVSFFTELFNKAIDGMDLNGLMAILTFLQFLMAYVIGIFGIISLLFGLVMTIPSAVMNWIGGQLQLGQDHANHTGEKIAGAVALTNKLGGGPGLKGTKEQGGGGEEGSNGGKGGKDRKGNILRNGGDDPALPKPKDPDKRD